MDIHIAQTPEDMARAAAQRAAHALRTAIEVRGNARFVAATGNSQLLFLEYLTGEPGIDWSKTTMFHLDEYLGLPDDHPASFVGYLRRRLVEKTALSDVHFLRGDAASINTAIRSASDAIASAPIDVAFVGIGENGHLAFNDPPADFETRKPYITVELDGACRTQQVNEGWFPDVETVPTHAVTMSIHQIMQSERIICTVPDRRKATAVRGCLSDRHPVSPDRPASILREHRNCHVFLDEAAASLL
ncbi:MAG: glucosamine-6-phosphate deaminase [Spirochaetales bacterium]|nr:glucosamine-6-phosphate deaminase [Spirochaetales bacterium]